MMNSIWDLVLQVRHEMIALAWIYPALEEHSKLLRLQAANVSRGEVLPRLLISTRQVKLKLTSSMGPHRATQVHTTSNAGLVLTMLWALKDFSTVGTSGTSTCRARRNMVSRNRVSTRRVNMGRANGTKTGNLGNVQGRNSRRCTSRILLDTDRIRSGTSRKCSILNR